MDDRRGSFVAAIVISEYKIQVFSEIRDLRNSPTDPRIYKVERPNGYKWETRLQRATCFDDGVLIVTDSLGRSSTPSSSIIKNAEVVANPSKLLAFDEPYSALFEQRGDVVTRTALKRINWNSYKINQMQDKIGVFVSIVSTKYHSKGQGKNTMEMTSVR